MLLLDPGQENWVPFSPRADCPKQLVEGGAVHRAVSQAGKQAIKPQEPPVVLPEGPANPQQPQQVPHLPGVHLHGGRGKEEQPSAAGAELPQQREQSVGRTVVAVEALTARMVCLIHHHEVPRRGF